MKGTHPAVAKVIKQAQKQGATVSMTGSGHFQIRTNKGVTHASVSPRNGDNAARNLRRQLRKDCGLDL